jgi:hypothetical protein
MLFINQCAIDFISEYDAYAQGKAVPLRYRERSEKYCQAEKYFEGCLNRFVAMKQGK